MPWAIHCHPTGQGLSHSLVPFSWELPGALSQAGPSLLSGLGKASGYQAWGSRQGPHHCGGRPRFQAVNLPLWDSQCT